MGETVHPGDLGGFVQSEENLSQDGPCWVFQNAIAAEDAVVAGNAQIRDHAVVRGSALISGKAVVLNHSLVEDRAIVTAGVVAGDSRVAGNARITKSPWTQAAPHVESSLVYGDISGNVRLTSGAQVLPGQIFDNPTLDELHITDEHIKIVRGPERETPALTPPENWTPAQQKSRSHPQR